MDLFDLHQNTEWPARLDQVLSPTPVDWAGRRGELADEPQGLARLQRLSAVPRFDLDTVADEVYEGILESALTDSARGGARYTELRLPQESVVYPGFMERFESARSRVAESYDGFDAGAVLSLNLWEPTVRRSATPSGTPRSSAWSASSSSTSPTPPRPTGRAVGRSPRPPPTPGWASRSRPGPSTPRTWRRWPESNRSTASGTRWGPPPTRACCACWPTAA
ncbi:hypothetical protein GCM10029992_31060 [Glycomyces albus]